MVEGAPEGIGIIRSTVARLIFHDLTPPACIGDPSALGANGSVSTGSDKAERSATRGD